MLLEFLADLLDLLLATETLLVLHLFQAAFFVLSVGGLEATFGVTVDLVGVSSSSQGQSVEGIVDTGCGEGRQRRGGIEAGEIETAGLLLGGFGIACFLRWQGCVFFGQESCLFGLLAIGFGFLVGGGSTGGGRL